MKTNRDDTVIGNKEFETGALTKREYFAALAMQGILAHKDIGPIYGSVYIADLAVENADELIKALNEERSNDE